MKAIDLHVHSTYSDGTFTPKQLIDYSIEKKLSALALTDHDTVDGLAEAICYISELSMTDDVPSEDIPELINGIELSTEYMGRDVHILGLYIDPFNVSFNSKLKEFVDSRTVRNQKMCALLREAGVDITYEALVDAFPDSVITRAHYAKYMLEHGYVKSIPEAFDRYVGDHCPCYVPREKITPSQAVELILEAKGIPVLAHPVLYHLSDANLDKLVATLKAAGLMGIETIYSSNKPHEERAMRTLAAKYDLLITGGSDFHGTNKPGLDLGCGYGKLFIPEDLLIPLKKARFSEDNR